LRNLNTFQEKTVFFNAMRRKLTPAILIFSATVGIIIAFQSKGLPLLSGTQRGDEESQVSGTIEYASSYTLVDENELFARTEIAFVGEVIGFGPSLWNSDNNDSPASVQEWESTSSSLHHQVKLKGNCSTGVN
jgi:hypothetical protein